MVQNKPSMLSFCSNTIARLIMVTPTYGFITTGKALTKRAQLVVRRTSYWIAEIAKPRIIVQICGQRAEPYLVI